MTIDNDILRHLKRIRDELGRLIQQAEDETGPPESEYRRWFRRMGAVLNAVEQAGGAVEAEQWRRIGVGLGYDPRGLAGFFAGQDSTMRRDRHTDIRRLTARGKEEAARWRRLFGDDGN